MNDAAVLERRYRWLLRWYPRWFRDDIEDEVLGVLMAGARDGKRWPSAAEAADVLGSALRMRLRLPRPGTESHGWSDAWAVFSVLGPVFVLLTNIVVVLVPPSFLRVHVNLTGYAGPLPLRTRWLTSAGYALYGSAHGFYAELICEAILVILVLAGWRRVSLGVLVAFAAFWMKIHYTFPPPVFLINAAAGILELVALAASPGPRRGRSLLNWGHGAVLVVVIAAVKLSSITSWVLRSITGSIIYPAASQRGTTPQLAGVLLLGAGALLVIAAAAAMRLRLGRHALWIGAALLYSYVLEFAFVVFGSRSFFDNFLGFDVTPLHMVVLFLGPAVMAVLALLIAARGRLASFHAGLTPGS